MSVNHNKIYDNHFQIDEMNPRMCEITGYTREVDVHHIDARGMGGRKSMDFIENLMGLRRVAHDWFGDKVKYKEFLKEVHRSFMEKGVPFIEIDPYHPIMVEFLRNNYNKMK